MRKSPDTFPADTTSTPDGTSQGSSLFPKSIASKIAMLSLGAAALSNTGCGNVVVEQTVIGNDAGAGAPTQDAGTPKLPCSPIPYCPEVYVTIGGPDKPNQTKNFYLQTGRWQRINPATGEAIKVCEPIKGVTCNEDQTPEKDHCDLPVCPDAKTCDPIPARQGLDDYRTPFKANYPTSSNAATALPYIDGNDVDYPVIYDNTEDCKNGESPNGDTYYACDEIPTCPEDKQIPYCDPLPRCAEGQSPISCEEGKRSSFSTQDMCNTQLNDTNNFLGRYRLDLLSSPGGKFCQPEFDPNINETVYKMPVINVVCLPTRECANGEIPTSSFLSVPMECNGVTWQSGQSAAPSCDPIKSCK